MKMKDNIVLSVVAAVLIMCTAVAGIFDVSKDTLSKDQHKNVYHSF